MKSEVGNIEQLKLHDGSGTNERKETPRPECFNEFLVPTISKCILSVRI